MSIGGEDPSTSPPTTVKDLLRVWRLRADRYRDMGIEPAARAVEECARELRALHHVLREEELTLEEAAEECGYSRDHLYRLTRKGKLNFTKHDGRVWLRRLDLPRKGRAPYVATEAEVFDEPI